MAIDETGLTKGLVRKIVTRFGNLSVTTSPKRSSLGGWSGMLPYKPGACQIPWR